MKKILIFVLSIMVIKTAVHISAQDKTNGIKIEVTKLGPNLYKLRYGNVNLVALIGPQGVLLSDTAIERAALTLKSELKKLGSDSIKYIINTHWHHDHTGGNIVLGKEAIIIAHQNVRELLSEKQVLEYWEEEYKAFPEYARPHITFSNSLTIYFNGEEIEITHFPNSHSNGDAIVYFKKNNVLHLGDLLFSDGFPAIDFENGGNIEQFVLSLQKIIEMMPPDVKIIAGHGRDYSITDLKKYTNIMHATLEVVLKEMKIGKSLEEMKNAKVLSEWEEWGKGHFPCNKWIEMVYFSLDKNRKRKHGEKK